MVDDDPKLVCRIDIFEVVAEVEVDDKMCPRIASETGLYILLGAYLKMLEYKNRKEIHHIKDILL